jgi:hypothetical protein
MNESQIIARLDELGAAARRRMDRAPNQPGLAWAEIIWMTEAEVSEMHDLKALLPSSGQSRHAAIARIAARLDARKLPAQREMFA